jgi:hypothetical protein
MRNVKTADKSFTDSTTFNSSNGYTSHTYRFFGDADTIAKLKEDSIADSFKVTYGGVTTQANYKNPNDTD